ncbi:hypothetical protein VKT23_012418 [Stygiomarasmius scandens]|uniref:Uncharacterized protein n=1 Tax=Marasmiellus scandens TaxID=2682957 RepID=A0ABR1JBF5_9AGAR
MADFDEDDGNAECKEVKDAVPGGKGDVAVNSDMAVEVSEVATDRVETDVNVIKVVVVRVNPVSSVAGGRDSAKFREDEEEDVGIGLAIPFPEGTTVNRGLVKNVEDVSLGQA